MKAKGPLANTIVGGKLKQATYGSFLLKLWKHYPEFQRGTIIVFPCFFAFCTIAKKI